MHGCKMLLLFFFWYISIPLTIEFTHLDKNKINDIIDIFDVVVSCLVVFDALFCFVFF